MELLGQERSLTISSAVWIQYTNVTDGQTLGDSKDRVYAQRRTVIKFVSGCGSAPDPAGGADDAPPCPLVD